MTRALTITLVTFATTFLLTSMDRNVTAIASQQQAAEADQDHGDDHDHEHDDPEEAAENESGAVIDTADQTKPEPLGDKFIRFHMWDGAVVGGNVSITHLTISTEFGDLEVPVDRVTSFYPGLDSFPERNAKIEMLVEGLGDRDYDVREKSHRALSAMGMQLREQFDEFDDGGSAERKKHLADLRKEMEEQLEVAEDDAEDLERALIRGDMIITPKFSVVGKIKQPTFEISSRYGQLTINLSDIRFADRSFNQPKEDIRKTVAVPGSTFFQNTPKSTRIRVNKGDRIAIRSSGSVNWTNWNNTSSPDGLTNHGQWKGINCGTLVARIGTSDEIIKVGSKADFKAKRSGVLYLGIAITDNFAKNNGYRWEGDFKAKIVVKPADK